MTIVVDDDVEVHLEPNSHISTDSNVTFYMGLKGDVIKSGRKGKAIKKVVGQVGLKKYNMLAPQLCIVNNEKRKFPNNIITHDDLDDAVEGV